MNYYFLLYSWSCEDNEVEANYLEVHFSNADCRTLPTFHENSFRNSKSYIIFLNYSNFWNIEHHSAGNLSHYLFVIRFNRYFSIQLEKKCDLWSEWREECYNWSFFSWLYILVLHILLHSDRPEKAVRNIKASSCIMVLMNWSRWKEMPSITLCWRSYHYGMHIKLPSMVVLLS